MQNFCRYFIFLATIALAASCSKSKTAANSENDSDSTSIYLSRLKDKDLNPSLKLKYANAAYNLISNEKNSALNREQLNSVGLSFYQLNDQLKFRNINVRLLSNSIKASDTVNIEKAYKNLGTYHIDMNHNDSSFYYYLKAEKLAVYLNDSASLGAIHIDKAFIQLYESDFYGSEISASKALGYLNKSINKFKIYDAYNLIGVSSNELKNYEKALEYHNKALKYLRDNNLNNKFHLDASSLNNIGYVYQNMNKNKEAITNFNLALNSSKTLFRDNPSLYAMLLDNLAYSKFKLKDYSQLPGLFYRSLKIRDSLKRDLSGIILNKIHLSELYAAKQDTIQAKVFAREALDFSRKTKVSSDILISLQQLSSVEHQKAAEYSREYIKISDSLQQEERKAKDRFARIAFETDEIILEKDKLAEQNRSLLYFFVGTLLIGLLLFIIRNQRAKNRELLLVQAQQKANEDIYNLMISQQATIEESRVKEKKRIAQELHDGVLGRLFGARLNLDSLNKFNDEESINSRFNYLSELKNIEQDIREISHDLNREKYVLINNFIAIVNNLLEEQKNSHHPEVTSTIDETIKWDTISNSIKINLYRILQESLQNINKYANAKNITIQIKETDGSIILKVADDGEGFNVGSRKKGIGLQNMLSRANECNGVLDVKSKPGKGTTITITVPVTDNISMS